MVTDRVRILWRSERVNFWRNRQELWMVVGFYLLTVVIFAIGLRSTPSQMQQFAPGIIWVAMLFALMLSFERLFAEDYREGVIEQWQVSDTSLYAYVVVKLFAHLLLTAGITWLITPIAALILHMRVSQTIVLMLSLAAAFPAMIVLGALMSALTVGLRQASSLLVMLLMPLYIPILLFGMGASILHSLGLAASGAFASVGAISTLCLLIGPWAIAKAIK